MSDDAKKLDARYADFASRMLASEQAEIADIAKINARFSVPVASQALETARPSKG